MKRWPHRLYQECARALLAGGVALCAMAVPVAQAEVLPEHPHAARGYGVDRAYEGTGPESVNLFNGNLALRIPLGLEYPVSSTLRYQFLLHYNSHIWAVTQTDPLLAGQGISDANLFSAPVKGNAGLGWNLGFGELLAPGTERNKSPRWVYVSPDGAAHGFYSTLHADVTETDAADAVQYTRDSNYLRMQVDAAGDRVIEAPGGLRTVFHAFSATDWRLTRIQDRDGNSVSVAYAAGTWTVSDSHGRTHTVNLDASGNVTSVVLQAFNGRTATYALTYTTGAAIPIHCGTQTLAPRHLTRVAQPDGTAYDFTYGDSAGGCEKAGRVRSMRLPTLGTTRWDYSRVDFPANSSPFLLRSRVGVSSRTLVDAAGGVLGTFTLAPTMSAQALVVDVTSPLGDITRRHFSVYTGADSGALRASDYGLPFVRTSPDATGGRFLSVESFDCDASAQSCTKLRSQYAAWEQDARCTPRTAQCAAQNRRAAGSRTLYHDDLDSSGAPRYLDETYSDFDGLGHFRRRTLGGSFGQGDARTEVIQYNPASGTYSPGYDVRGAASGVSNAGFLAPAAASPWLLETYGLVSQTEGSSATGSEHCFDAATGNLLRKRNYKQGTARTANDVVVVSTYAAGQLTGERHYGGELQTLDTASALCAMPLPATDAFHLRHDSQYGVRRASWFVDASGVALSHRTLDRDIDPTGLVKASRDSAGLQVDHDYDLLGRVTRMQPGTGHGGALHEYQYIAATGHPWTNGARTVHVIRPSAGATPLSTEQTYEDGFGRAVMTLHTKPDGTVRYRGSTYDALGQLTSENVDWVDAQWSSADRLRFHQNIDPFGRARRIVEPDGTVATRTFLGIRTVSESRQRAWYYLPSSGLTHQPWTVTKYLDRQGRVFMESETRYPEYQWGVPQVTYTNTYTHDVRGHLTSARRDGRQVQRYQYDGLGNLLLEAEPVPGWAFGVEQTRTHSRYDARGNVGRTVTRRPTSHSMGWYQQSVDYTYDRASRLRLIHDTANAGKVWKDYRYADANAAGDWRKGKLAEALRYTHNVLQPRFYAGVGIIKDVYTYGGTGGAVSRKRTEVADPLATRRVFEHSYATDLLGRWTRIDYPQCTGSCTTGTVRPPAYAAQYGYRGLELATVTVSNDRGTVPWVTDTRYHVSGQEASRTFGNGAVETLAQQTPGLRRVGSISVSGIYKYTTAGRVAATWSSGAFVYDGSGRVAQVGSDPAVQQYGQTLPGSAVSAYSAPCAPLEDPFDRAPGSYENGCLRADQTYLYDTDDQPVLRMDGTEMHWTLRDLSGRQLVEHVYEFWNWSSDPWLWTAYSVFDDTGTQVGREKRGPGLPGETRYIQKGGRVSTDAAANWLESQ